jgi:hypothetical protein
MTDHPDLPQAHHAAKQITRGGTQAADDQAMEAMWLAIERGESREEAGEIFIKTYQKCLHGKVNP